VREAPKLGSKHLTTRTEYIISESTIKSAFNYEEQDELVKSKVTEISDSGSKRTPRQKVDEDPLSPTEVLLAKKQEKLQAEEEKLKEQEATVRKLSAKLDEVSQDPKSEPSKISSFHFLILNKELLIFVNKDEKWQNNQIHNIPFLNLNNNCI